VAEMEVARRRLRREAQVLARLEHPGIVPLLAVEDDGTDVILVMPALAASLADRIRNEGKLSPGEVWRIGQVLLDALAWAHRQGVVHRDIKPANVLFDDAGRPALADFGIARSSDLTQGLTLAGSLLGTPAFIAPEQARGEPAGPPSDVFSLAATLSYALTRRSPYGEGDPVTQALRAARGQVRAELAGVPENLAGPLRAMLNPRPERRPGAAALLSGPSGTHPGGSRRFLPPPPLRGPAPHQPGIGPRLAAPSPGPSKTLKPPEKLTWRRVGRAIGRLLAGGPTRPGRRPRPVVALGIACIAVAAAIWIGLNLANRSPGTATASISSPTSVSSPTSLCAPLPYQPCGQTPAPHTDGLRCLPGWYDIDGNAADGCEARADSVGHQPLVAGQILSANLVPAGETDSYPLHVKGGAILSCGKKLTVTLRAPSGVTDRVEVLNGAEILGTASSSDGQPASVSVSKPSCFRSDPENLTVTVGGVTGASGADYTLTRTAGW
jgi:serine/threonine protein kinase